MNDQGTPAGNAAHDPAASAELTADPGSAMQALVDNHRMFLRFLERRVGSRETAEDLLQDAFGRALEHLDELRENESIVAWFYRVLRNAVIDHYRRSDAAHRAADAFARDFDEAVPPHEVQTRVCRSITTDRYRRRARQGVRTSGRHLGWERGRPCVPRARSAPQAGCSLLRHVRGAWMCRLPVREEGGRWAFAPRLMGRMGLIGLIRCP